MHNRVDWSNGLRVVLPMSMIFHMTVFLPMSAIGVSSTSDPSDISIGIGIA